MIPAIGRLVNDISDVSDTRDNESPAEGGQGRPPHRIGRFWRDGPACPSPEPELSYSPYFRAASISSQEGMVLAPGVMTTSFTTGNGNPSTLTILPQKVGVSA